MNIIGRKYIFLSFSGVLVLVSIASLLIWGLRPGIDFTGGSLLEVEFSQARSTTEEIRSRIIDLDIGAIAVQPTGESGAIIRFRHVDEPTHREILSRLAGADSQGQGILEKRFDTIGPTISSELRRRSIAALGVAILLIILYIAWAFRQVSRPVSSWKYGVVAVVALIHDILIPTGIFSILGHFRGVEVDTLFITALLTILGFSVHDTIVVFDRIRENLRIRGASEAYALTVNRSVNETITRSILTSFTVLLVLLAILFFGGESTRYFILTLIIGVTFGTYSSIFVASPLLVIWNSLTGEK